MGIGRMGTLIDFGPDEIQQFALPMRARNRGAAAHERAQKKKAPLPGPHVVTVGVHRGTPLRAPRGAFRTTSFSSELPSSLLQLSWLRSSSIESPNSNLRFQKKI